MKSFAYLIPIFLFSFAGAPAPEEKAICLTKEEQKLYDLIMEYRRQNKLPSIPLSSKLSQVAKVHGRDLSDNYNFDPNNKCNPHSWSKKGKWTSCCYTSDHKQAECMWNKPKEIAGYTSAGYEIAYYHSGGATAEQGLAGWKTSPGHNPLLVNSGIWEKVEWKAIGVALVGNYGLVWFGETEDVGGVAVCQ
jgi:uncharacterized protein YkwD